jgi:Na+-translocating membrane potential-generating system (MpsB)
MLWNGAIDFSRIPIFYYSGGAGTKAPLNIVGAIGMQQGTLGDLRTGLPSQMIDMRIPVRAFFLVDAPADRVKNVLRRNPDLEAMIFNDWVHLATRDPNTGLVSRYVKGLFVPCPLLDVIERKHLTAQSEWKTYQPMWERGLTVRRTEKIISLLAYFMIILSFVVPYVLLDTANMMNAHGTYIATCATAISLPILDFSRRYNTNGTYHPIHIRLPQLKTSIVATTQMTYKTSNKNNNNNRTTGYESIANTD